MFQLFVKEVVGHLQLVWNRESANVRKATLARIVGGKLNTSVSDTAWRAAPQESAPVLSMENLVKKVRAKATVHGSFPVKSILIFIAFLFVLYIKVFVKKNQIGKNWRNGLYFLHGFVVIEKVKTKLFSFIFLVLWSHRNRLKSWDG